MNKNALWRPPIMTPINYNKVSFWRHYELIKMHFSGQEVISTENDLPQADQELLRWNQDLFTNAQNANTWPIASKDMTNISNNLGMSTFTETELTKVNRDLKFHLPYTSYLLRLSALFRLCYFLLIEIFNHFNH